MGQVKIDLKYGKLEISFEGSDETVLTLIAGIDTAKMDPQVKARAIAKIGDFTAALVEGMMSADLKKEHNTTDLLQRALAALKIHTLEGDLGVEELEKEIEQALAAAN